MISIFPIFQLTLILQLTFINPCISFYNNYKSCLNVSSQATILSLGISQKSKEQLQRPLSSYYNSVHTNSNYCTLINHRHNNIFNVNPSRKKRKSSISSYSNNNNYDGDYRRRRHQRRKSSSNKILNFFRETPRNIFFPKNTNKWYNIQVILIYILTTIYLYQILSAVKFLPKLQQILLDSGNTRFSQQEIPLNVRDVIKQNLLGEKAIIFSPPSSSAAVARIRDPHLKNVMGRYNRRSPTLVSTLGPLAMDFIYQSYISKFQIHRYATSGFVHSSIFHLIFILYSLSKIPPWLSILDWNFYLTTFISSIIGGCIAHSYQNTTSFVLGASSGVCGLYGAMFVLYRKMRRKQKSNTLIKSMLLMVFVGCLNIRISNASHAGGFITG